MKQNRWLFVLGAILILLLASELIWYSPYTSLRKGSFSVLNVAKQSEGSMMNITITYQLNASLPLDATIVITPVRTNPKDLPVYVFYDVDYPAVGTDWVLVAMLQAHLKAELTLRGYESAIKLVNAEELKTILLAGEQAILIMASGAFPSNILSRDVNLIKPWIDSGGVLIWFGFYVGYYVVDKGMTKADIKDDDPRNLRQNGSKLLGLENYFEYLELTDNPLVADYSSPISEALGTSYDLIQQASFLHMVWADNGLVLGKIGGEEPSRFRSSISMVPRGRGRIVLFGFFLMQSLALNGPESAAWDIAQILSSGVMQMDPMSVMWHRDHRLAGGETLTGFASMTTDFEIAGLAVFEYTYKKSDGMLFYRDFINVTDVDNGPPITNPLFLR